MAQDASSEERLAALLETSYSIASWTSLVFFAAVLTWLIVALLQNTEPGTARSAASAGPQAAIVAHESEQPAGGCPPLRLPPLCAACHLSAGSPQVGVLGPALTGGRTVASQRIASPSYTGSAQTPEGYVRESILNPDAYVVPGDGYSSPGGASTMPAAVGEALSPLELDTLVRALLCQPEERGEQGG